MYVASDEKGPEIKQSEIGSVYNIYWTIKDFKVAPNILSSFGYGAIKFMCKHWSSLFL